MLGLGGNFLFDKRVNGFLTKMDDSTSMVSLALRDGVESSGRTVMEYKRDKHGGRERLIEEAATMTIWAFGINWMKNLYDWMAKDVTKAIDLPDLDTSLLKPAKGPVQQGGFKNFYKLFSTPSAQSLVSENGVIKESLEKNFIKGSSALGKLTDIAKNQSQKYAFSNMGKFLFATGIPVAGIAFGIPTFNQWLTRKKIDQEQKKQTGGNAQSVKFQTPKPQAFAPVVANNFTGFQPRQGTFGNPYGVGTQPQSAFNQASFNPSASQGKNQVRFGGNLVGDAASALLQNERMNTLLVDGVISGGRFYKGRTWGEKLEIAFREGSIIGFLYFGQRFLQNIFTNKMFGGGSNLNFDATRFMKNAYGDKAHHGQFFKDLEAARGELVDILSPEMKEKMKQKEGMAFWKNVWSHDGRAKIRTAQETAFNTEKKLVEKIQEYFHKGSAEAGKHNLIFETAKECGWIPTFDGKAAPSKGQVWSETLRNTGKKVKNGAQFLINPGKDEVKEGAARYLSGSAEKHLNITKKIDTDAILNFVKHLEKDIVPHEGKVAVEQLMKKAISRRGAAWLASNAVCTLFLSYLCPKLQHYITYKRTGKDYFPGVQA